jgi:hypothetical protein
MSRKANFPATLEKMHGSKMGNVRENCETYYRKCCCSRGKQCNVHEHVQFFCEILNLVLSCSST